MGAEDQDLNYSFVRFTFVYRMFYSHIWDGLLKLVSLVSLAIAAFHLKVGNLIQSGGIPNSAARYVSIGIVGVVWVVLYRQCLSIFSTWIYATVSLRTRVTLAEAKALRKLFQLDCSLTWVPLREIPALPKEQCHDALLTTLGTHGKDRKRMFI